MKTRMNLKGRTAVVTGAASGIGRALAVCLARRGCHLALADINEAGLAETAEAAAPQGVRLSTHRLDVGDRGAVAAFPSTVKAKHSGVDLLFNNAGVALGGTFEQLSEGDFEWLFDINFGAVVVSCCGSCQSRQEATLCGDVIAFALEDAAPAEIVWEIFRGHAVEPAHPGFEAAMIGVDVLNMRDAPAPFAAASRKSYITDAGFGSERSTGARAIADEHGVLIPSDNWRENPVELAYLEAFEHGIGRGARAAAQHQYRNLFV